MSDKYETRLKVWRPLRVGDVVLVKGGLRGGQRGVVRERLDELLTGYERYGLELETLPGTTMDFCRHELKPVKRGGK